MAPPPQGWIYLGIQTGDGGNRIFQTTTKYFFFCIARAYVPFSPVLRPLRSFPPLGRVTPSKPPGCRWPSFTPRGAEANIPNSRTRMSTVASRSFETILPPRAPMKDKETSRLIFLRQPREGVGVNRSGAHHQGVDGGELVARARRISPTEGVGEGGQKRKRKRKGEWDQREGYLARAADRGMRRRAGVCLRGAQP